jgi:hypothetical protein
MFAADIVGVDNYLQRVVWTGFRVAVSKIIMYRVQVLHTIQVASKSALAGRNGVGERLTFAGQSL